MNKVWYFISFQGVHEDHRHVCDICGKLFKLRGSLLVHQVLYHQLILITKKVTIRFYPSCRGWYTIPFLDRRARTGHFHAEFAIESSQTNIEGIIMKKDTVNLCLPEQK